MHDQKQRRILSFSKGKMIRPQSIKRSGFFKPAGKEAEDESESEQAVHSDVC